MRSTAPSRPVPVALACATLTITGCARTSPVAVIQEAVVYGDDGRVELEDADPSLRDFAGASVVAMMQRSALRIHSGSVELDAPTLGTAENLCPGERFADQPSVAECSGVLLDSRTVLTAGHCMRGIPCRDAAFVFGYSLHSDEMTPSLSVADVYGCDEVLATELSAPGDLARLDYAWVQLDRAAPQRVRRFAWRPTSESLERGESVTVAGFGGGIPMKVDYGGEVADARIPTLDYFLTTTDTFHGDSGAPVLDSLLRLIGIQVRGNTDYLPSNAGCNVVAHLPDDPNAAGEQNTYAARALAGLCAAKPKSDLCCQGDACTQHVESSFGCSVARTGGEARRDVWLMGLTLVGLMSRLLRRRSNGRRHF